MWAIHRTGLRRSADPANPGSYHATHIVDTLSRGNYVGMWGIGEICTSPAQGRYEQ